jgi:hypothetical protein
VLSTFKFIRMFFPIYCYVLKQTQYRKLLLFYYYLWLCSPARAMASLFHNVSWSHTMTRHSQLDFSGRVISLLQRPLPDNTQHTQQINIHVPGGIETHDRSRWAAVDLCIRPLGHWDLQYRKLLVKNSLEYLPKIFLEVHNIYIFY